MSDKIRNLLKQHIKLVPTNIDTDGIPGWPNFTQIHEMCDDFSIRINLGGFLQHPRSVPSHWRSAADNFLTKTGLKAAIAAGWKYISIDHYEKGGLFLIPPLRWYDQVGFDQLYNKHREIWKSENVTAEELVQKRNTYRMATKPYREGSLPRGHGVKSVSRYRQEYFDLLIKVAAAGEDGRVIFLKLLDGEMPEVAAVLGNLTTTEKGRRLPQLQLEEVPAIKTVRWQRGPVSLWEKQLEPHCERLGWNIAERSQRASNLLAGLNSTDHFPDLVTKARAENMTALQFSAELQRLKLTIELRVFEVIANTDNPDSVSAQSVHKKVRGDYEKVNSIFKILIKLGNDLSWDIRNEKSLHVSIGLQQGGIVQRLLANSNRGSEGLREFREALATLGPEFKSWQVALRHLETSPKKRRSIHVTAKEEGFTYAAIHRKMGKLLDGSKDKDWGLNSHRKKRSPKKKTSSVTLKTDPLFLQTFWELGRVVFPDIVEVAKISVLYVFGVTSRIFSTSKPSNPRRRMFTLKDALATIRRTRLNYQHVNEIGLAAQHRLNRPARLLPDLIPRESGFEETSIDKIERVQSELRLRTKPRRLF